MDFNIPDDLKMVQSLVRDFVRDQLRPLERDILGRAADLSDARISLTSEVEKKLIGIARDIGLWGVGIPEELGGVGLSTLGLCLVEEELAKTVVPFNLGDVSPILFECNNVQKERYFLPLLHRQRQVYLALIEPGRGANLLDMVTKAEKADGHYAIDGIKLSFSRADAAEDYFVVVFAVTAEDREPRERVSCFLADKGAPGIRVVNDGQKSGWRTQVREPVCVVFEHCSVPAENLLGEEGKAFSLGKRWLPARRVVRGARCVGVAARLLEEATMQAQSWQSFGQSISGRVDIQAALADIAVDMHACRLMVHEAAWKSDEGKATGRESAVVRLYATEMIHRVADRVAHIFNGPPYVAGLSMEKLCRHVLATSAVELALELQRSVIARDVMKGLKV